MVLHRVGEAVEQEIDSEKGEAVRRRFHQRSRFRSWFGWLINGEYRNSSGYCKHDEILRQWVSFMKQRDAQPHYREELARLSKDKSEVVDMRQRGVAERRSEC